MDFRIIRVTRKQELDQAIMVRKQVFIEEQGVDPALEIDGLDQEAQHVIALQDGQAAGTGRLRIEAQKARFERIAVLPAARGKGIGRAIMQRLETMAAGSGAVRGELHAQVPVRAFYEQLGWQVTSDVFLEAGIEHVTMEKPLNAA